MPREVSRDHRHQADPSKTQSYPYRGHIEIPVGSNPKSRGGVCITEECECGARRSSNLIDGTMKTGNWEKTKRRRK
jgi:hypothetical protein